MFFFDFGQAFLLSAKTLDSKEAGTFLSEKLLILKKQVIFFYFTQFKMGWGYLYILKKRAHPKE